MRIFTISSGRVSDGATVGSLTLKGASITIPAIFIGEEGRGRDRGVLPVQLLPEQQKEWEEKGQTKVEFGEIGQTKAGKPRLYAKAQPGSNDTVILVMPTTIGFRGGNSHTGDRLTVPCPERGKDSIYSYSGKCEKCGCELAKNEDSSYYYSHPDTGNAVQFEKFPGEIIVSGTIAQGDAGRMGSGSQYICTMPKDVVFRTSYSGRLYGAPSSHYYVWNGERILAATWEERSSTDLF